MLTHRGIDVWLENTSKRQFPHGTPTIDDYKISATMVVPTNGTYLVRWRRQSGWPPINAWCEIYVPNENDSQRVANHYMNKADPDTQIRSSKNRMELPFKRSDLLKFPAQPIIPGTTSLGYVRLEIRRAQDRIFEEAIQDTASNSIDYAYDFIMLDDPLENKPPWISFQFNFTIETPKTPPGDATGAYASPIRRPQTRSQEVKHDSKPVKMARISPNKINVRSYPTPRSARSSARLMRPSARELTSLRSHSSKVATASSPIMPVDAVMVEDSSDDSATNKRSRGTRGRFKKSESIRRAPGSKNSTVSSSQLRKSQRLQDAGHAALVAHLDSPQPEVANPEPRDSSAGLSSRANLTDEDDLMISDEEKAKRESSTEGDLEKQYRAAVREERQVTATLAAKLKAKRKRIKRLRALYESAE